MTSVIGVESIRTSVALLAVSICIGTLGCGRRNVVSTTVQVVATPSPQTILAAQPDFVAEELSGDFETMGGTTFPFKLAKKGEWYRTATDVAVIFSSAEEPDVRYFVKAKTFDLPQSNKAKRAWHAQAQFPALLARDQAVNFEMLGDETIDGHPCARIRATKPNENDAVVVLLYAAKDLKNLVILTNVTRPGRRQTFHLRNVSFDVPDNLFTVLARRPRANL